MITEIALDLPCQGIQYLAAQGYRPVYASGGMSVSCFCDQIALDMPGIHSEEYDNSNALALPGRKRKKKAEEEDLKPKVRKLTKKERKRLEKIKAVKEKKARVSVLR